jgi:hypothetical protein
MTIDATRGGLRADRLDAAVSLSNKATESLGESQSLGNLPDFGAMLAQAASEVSARAPRAAAVRSDVAPRRDRLEQAVSTPAQQTPREGPKVAEPSAEAREKPRATRGAEREGEPREAITTSDSDAQPKAEQANAASRDEQVQPVEQSEKPKLEEPQACEEQPIAVAEQANHLLGGSVGRPLVAEVPQADASMSADAEAPVESATPRIEERKSDEATVASADSLTKSVASLTPKNRRAEVDEGSEASRASREAPAPKSDSSSGHATVRREARRVDADESSLEKSDANAQEPVAAKTDAGTAIKTATKHDTTATRSEHQAPVPAARSATPSPIDAPAAMDVRAKPLATDAAVKSAPSSSPAPLAPGAVRATAKPSLEAARLARAEKVEKQLEQMMRTRRQDAVDTAVNRMTLRQGAQGSIDIPELGTVRVAARMRAGEVDVDLRAQRPDTVTVLQSAGAALEAELRHSAVNVRHVDIDREEREPSRDGDSEPRDFQQPHREQQGEPQDQRHDDPRAKPPVRFML